MLRRLLRLIRRTPYCQQPARVILIDECGHRLEYVQETDDPIFWGRPDRDEAAGYNALIQTVETFINARAPKGSA